MFKHKWPGLCRVTTRAGLLLAGESRATAANRTSLVRLVTVRATHLAFDHRMMRGKIELAARVEMTLEADIGRFAGIDHRVCRTTGLDVKTSRPVTGFAADVLGVCTLGFQPRMGRGGEITHEFGVTFRAGFRSDKLRAGNVRRRNHHALERGAGDEHHRNQDECENERDSTMSGKRAKT